MSPILTLITKAMTKEEKYGIETLKEISEDICRGLRKTGEVFADGKVKGLGEKVKLASAGFDGFSAYKKFDLQKVKAELSDLSEAEIRELGEFVIDALQLQYEAKLVVEFVIRTLDRLVDQINDSVRFAKLVA